MKLNNILSRRKSSVIFFISGSVTGLILISIFVFGVDNPSQQWGTYWKIKPLILTPLLCGLGALASNWVISIAPNTSAKYFYWFISIIGFLFSVWVAIVLGLNGTLWD
jgi:hypothetical protein